MDKTRKMFREIEPLSEEELDKDLRFLYYNRGETADQFVEEAIPMVKYHVNEVMATYQDRLIERLTDQLKGEIVSIVLRVRRETVFHPKATIGRTPEELTAKIEEMRQAPVPVGGEDEIQAW